MWNILKYELKYYWYNFLVLLIAIVLYTVLVIVDIKLNFPTKFDVDPLIAIFSLIIYGFSLTVWSNRIKERRLWLHHILPISEKQNSYLRFSFALLPFVSMIIYLIVLHLIIFNNWHSETASLINQIGVCLILFSGFLKTRDDWYSYWNLGKRFRSAFVTVFIVQIIALIIVFEEIQLNKSIVESFGINDFLYSNLIFPLLGFILLITSIYSFRKRRSYLA